MKSKLEYTKSQEKKVDLTTSQNDLKKIENKITTISIRKLEKVEATAARWDGTY